MKLRGGGLLALALAIPMAAAGCGGQASSGTAKAASANGSEYVIGQIADLTGGFTEADVPFDTGITADVKAINGAGGINGHKIRLVTLDTAGSTARAASDLQTLASDNALIATNMSDSTIFQSLLPAATRDRISLMGIQPAQPQVATPNGYAFEFGLSATRSTEAMVGAVAATTKSAKIAAVVTADPDGQALSNAIKQQSTALGLDYVGSVAPASASAYGAAAARVVADKATVVLTELVGTAETNFINDLKSAGFPSNSEIIGMAWSAVKPPMPWSHFSTLEQYRQTGNSSAVVAYQKAIRAAGADPNTVMVVDGYAEMQIVKNVLGRCGWPCPLTKFHKTLEHTNTNLNGLAFGPIVFTPTNHFGPTAGALLQYSSAGYPSQYGPPVTGLKS